MAVNELERDYLAMLHQCDMIDNVYCRTENGKRN